MSLVSLRQAAELLGVSEKTVRRMIDRGEIPARVVGQRAIRINQDDLHGAGELIGLRRKGFEEPATTPSIPEADFVELCQQLRSEVAEEIAVQIEYAADAVPIEMATVRAGLLHAAKIARQGLLKVGGLA